MRYRSNFLDVRERRAVVVGGGKMAERQRRKHLDVSTRHDKC